MEGNFSDPLKFASGLSADQRGRVRPKTFFNLVQTARPVRRRVDREQKAVELNSNVPVRDERNKGQESLEVKV